MSDGNVVSPANGGNQKDYTHIDRRKDVHVPTTSEVLAYTEDGLREITAERDALRKELDTQNYACGDALDKLWKDVILSRKPNYGDWEYAGQAYRHLKAEFDELLQQTQWTHVAVSLPGEGDFVYVGAHREEGEPDWQMAAKYVGNQGEFRDSHGNVIRPQFWRKMVPLPKK